MTAVVDIPRTVVTEEPSPGYSAGLRRRAREIVSAPGLALSWIVIVVVILWALVPGLFTSKSPYDGDVDASFAPPSFEHPFGADRLGRDLLARTIYGTSTTLTATLVAVAVGFVIGSATGLLSGFIGGRADGVVMRFVDVLLAIPGLLLAMTVVTALGYGTLNVAVAVGITAIAAFARVMRSEVLKVAHTEFVEASYGSGAKFGRVVLQHVLPNSLAAVLSLAALEFGAAILAVAALGFLGYGAPPPQPEWGLAVSEGRDYLAVYPWIAIFPGIVIAVVVLSTNRISKSLGESR
ncbi:peptide ABC transporter permease [Rhodococcus sp. ACPA4]|uniref:ABC transporter permease n=1 Tax=unclassified Rhodococcus (in: high G+C Gram-positive bacteria) TaxID=192944 RepID=UPI000BB13673|nr:MULTISPECIES: ABC transporter permease [unclassified Rhodococcus (in: high G+C Gram-positive bacteria)]PBC40788.1 peptide ABC transporter permease [Rhodococcus sp. ACPA4]ROZ46063.1 ABC transporter permease [Rhodococcus sp. WS3]RZL25166.1 MAG: ABC transporter permease [Rhodococcus sp. (in: high G+C Gram-positive bacteria)]